MSEFFETYKAVEGVVRLASSLRLINCVGFDQAKAVETLATNVLRHLEVPERTMRETAPLVCQLASECIHLVDAVNLDLAADMSLCFDQVGLVIWGFSLEVAEIISFALAGVASLLSIGKHDMSIPSHRHAKRSEFAGYLERVGSQIDGISMHIYGGLCRLEVGRTGETGSTSSEEGRLMEAFQCICVWILAIVYNFEGTGQLSNDVLWEWSSQDPLFAFVLVKGVLLFRNESVAISGLLVPADLPEMKEALVGASLGLGAHHIAFKDELNAGVIADNLDEVSNMSQRLVSLSLHRVRLAVAAIDCDFIDTLIQVILQAAMTSWVPALASFLSCLTQPPQGGAATWDALLQLRSEPQNAQEVYTFSDAHEATESFAATIDGPTLWSLLHCIPSSQHLTTSAGIGGGTGFLLDCATLAYAVPPTQDACINFLSEACLAGSTVEDLNPVSMAALCALAANGGVPPGGDLLTSSVEILSLEARALAAGSLHRCRAPIRHSEILQLWAAMLGPPSAIQTQEEILISNICSAISSSAPCTQAPGDDEVQQKGPSSFAIREIVQGAPKELCCALDGKLLMDPVRSPHGHIYERSNLGKALARTPGTCPVTGLPLTLEDCPRAGDVRGNAARWVRQVKPMQRA